MCVFNHFMFNPDDSNWWLNSPLSFRTEPKPPRQTLESEHKSSSIDSTFSFSKCLSKCVVFHLYSQAHTHQLVKCRLTHGLGFLSNPQLKWGGYCVQRYCSLVSVIQAVGRTIWGRSLQQSYSHKHRSSWYLCSWKGVCFLRNRWTLHTFCWTVPDVTECYRACKHNMLLVWCR